MKKVNLGIAALSAILVAAAPPLIRAATEPGQDLATWRDDLQAADLDAREARFDELVRALGSDPELAEAVRSWSAGADELAWTARLALREAERARAPLGHRRFFPGDDFPELRGFDFRGLDPGALFDADPDAWPFPGFGPGGAAPFGGLRLQPDDEGSSQGESVSIETGPDGVRVEIVTAEDGDRDTQVYEAESLEALLEEHPELRDRIGGTRVPGGPKDPFGAFRRGPGGGFPGFQPFVRGFEPFGSDPWGRARAPRPRTDRLGVLVTPIEAGAEHGPDHGLIVDRVYPDSLAAALGLTAGDILLELDGATIHAPDDVALALGARGDGNPVRARILRGDDERVLEWAPRARPSADPFEGRTRRL